MSESEQRLPAARDLQAQAIKWVVDRHVTENWTEQDQSKLTAWLDESPTHLVAYWRAKDSWNRTELLGALRSLRSPRPQRSHVWTQWAWRAAGAAAVLLIGAAAAAYLSAPVEKRYATAIGSRQTLTLRDGSQIEMNTATALRIGSSGNKRFVTLERGEAYFRVRHDDEHPFVVKVGNHRIVDLGTKFAVRTDGPSVRVSLVEGLARIDDYDSAGRVRSTILKPGDVAVATAKSISVSKELQPMLAKQLSWRRGILVFDNVALADVAAEFNRYNEQKIVISDPAAARLRIMGSFQANDLEAVPNIAREVFKLRVMRERNRILISH